MEESETTRQEEKKEEEYKPVVMGKLKKLIFHCKSAEEEKEDKRRVRLCLFRYPLDVGLPLPMGHSQLIPKWVVALYVADTGSTTARFGRFAKCFSFSKDFKHIFCRNPAAADADRPRDGVQQRHRGPAGPSGHQQLRPSRFHALVLELQHVKKNGEGRKKDDRWTRSILMMITRKENDIQAEEVERSEQFPVPPFLR